MRCSVRNEILRRKMSRFATTETCRFCGQIMIVEAEKKLVTDVRKEDAAVPISGYRSY